MNPPKTNEPLQIINSRAPIRICDIGGWTDTWFARYGQVFNIAVSPYIEVQVEVNQSSAKEAQVLLSVKNFSDEYAFDLKSQGWGRHPLLEAAIRHIGVPEELSIKVQIYSAAPAGASTGTSAAVIVALIGALDRLTPGQLNRKEIAEAAHTVETELLGRQSGIQDQLCSAYGGINFIIMSEYPNADVIQVNLPKPIYQDLERRLALVYMGTSHDSSRVHEQVIAELEGLGPDCTQLQDLRTAAVMARDALLAGDIQSLGQAMQANTNAQERLHPGLVSFEARKVIEIAREHSALGWKVNGAGGEGGSLTLLCGPNSAENRDLLNIIQGENPQFKLIPISLDRYGIRIWGDIPPSI